MSKLQAKIARLNTAVPGPARAHICAIDARRQHLEGLAKKRRRAGSLVALAVSQTAKRRKAQFDGHGEPRCKTIGAVIDAHTEKAIIAEAKKRGMAKGALIGRLVELIAEDDLWAAVLDDAH